MCFNSETVKSIIEDAVTKKLSGYNPETSYRPFHDYLFGRDFVALYSLIHSLSTTMGTSIYEPIAAHVAECVFDEVKQQYSLSPKLTDSAQAEINKIINELSHGGTISSNHQQEISRLRKVCQDGKVVEKKLTKVDLLLTKGDTRFLIDIKTVKPNKGSFQDYKRMLLEWSASVLYENPNADLRTIIAMPYNPYRPEPYRHWMLGEWLDGSAETAQILVGDQFWNFLAGGEDVYEDVLECFGTVGLSFKDQINELRKVWQLSHDNQEKSGG